MPSIEDLIAAMVRNPKGVAYADLRKVCVHHFGEPRRRGGSHEIFATPWAGDPRINIQKRQGKGEGLPGPTGAEGPRQTGRSRAGRSRR